MSKIWSYLALLSLFYEIIFLRYVVSLSCNQGYVFFSINVRNAEIISFSLLNNLMKNMTRIMVLLSAFSKIMTLAEYFTFGVNLIVLPTQFFTNLLSNNFREFFFSLEALFLLNGIYSSSICISSKVGFLLKSRREIIALKVMFL